MFNPVPQILGTIIALIFMSLPFFAVTNLPLAALALLKVGQLLGGGRKAE